MIDKGNSATSPKIPTPPEISKNKIVPKQIKIPERIIVFRKNQNVHRSTPDTLSPRVIGVTKKRIKVNHFDAHNRVHLFSTI
jgi:hypothetical protein